MTAYRRFEVAFLAGQILYIVAGFAVLASVWISIATLPSAVASADAGHVIYLLVAVGAAVAGAIGLVVCARQVLIAEWLALANLIRSRADLKPLHGWVTGSGPLFVWATVLIPVFAGVLMSFSPWLVAMLAGAAFAIVARSAEAGSAYTAYGDIKRKMGSIGIAPSSHPIVCMPIMALVLAVGGVVGMALAFDAARPAIGWHAESSIHAIDQQLNTKRALLPALQDSYKKRLELERKLLASERIRHSRGHASEADVQTAELRVLTLDGEALARIADIQDSIGRLERDRIDIESKRRSAASLAPALGR